MQRIGDAERDAAVESLRTHLGDGRINLDEFNDRMTAALSSRTQGELNQLFLDLPGGAPGQHRQDLVKEPFAHRTWRANRTQRSSKDIQQAGMKNAWVGPVLIAAQVLFVMFLISGAPWWLVGLLMPMLLYYLNGKRSLGNGSNDAHKFDNRQREELGTSDTDEPLGH